MFKYILNVSAFKKRCFVCLFVSLNRSPQAASRQGRGDVAGDSGLEGEIGGGGEQGGRTLSEEWVVELCRALTEGGRLNEVFFVLFLKNILPKRLWY